MKKILFLAFAILLTASSQDLIAIKGYAAPKQKAKISTPTKKMTRAEKNSSQHQQQVQQQKVTMEAKRAERTQVKSNRANRKANRRQAEQTRIEEAGKNINLASKFGAKLGIKPQGFFITSKAQHAQGKSPVFQSDARNPKLTPLSLTEAMNTARINIGKAIYHAPGKAARFIANKAGYRYDGKFMTGKKGRKGSLKRKISSKKNLPTRTVDAVAGIGSRGFQPSYSKQYQGEQSFMEVPPLLTTQKQKQGDDGAIPTFSTTFATGKPAPGQGAILNASQKQKTTSAFEASLAADRSAVTKDHQAAQRIQNLYRRKGKKRTPEELSKAYKESQLASKAREKARDEATQVLKELVRENTQAHNNYVQVVRKRDQSQPASQLENQLYQTWKTKEAAVNAYKKTEAVHKAQKHYEQTLAVKENLYRQIRAHNKKNLDANKIDIRNL